MPDATDPRRQPSSVVKPRFRLLANGEPVRGLVECTVHDNNFLAADKWSATVALGMDPARDAAFWADEVDTRIEILAAFVPESAPDADGLPWKSLLVGTVDDYDIDPVAGTVELTGRDLTGEFVDAQIVESFPNRTASEVAEEFASRHGMEASVTPTSGRIGQHYARDHMGSASTFSQTRSEWDLLTWLAQEEGYDIWVEGRTLHFHPARGEDGEPVRIACDPGVAEAGMGWAVRRPHAVLKATAERMRRSSRAARDISVTVESRDARGAVNARATVRGRSRASGYQQRQRQARASAADDAPASAYAIPLEGDPNEGRRSATSRGRTTVQAPARANARVSRYRFTVTGADEAECLRIAQAKLGELSQHERVVELAMPGELDLSARSRIRLEGNGHSFDQDYWVHEVERKFSVENGFTQTVTAKNTSPRDVERVGEDGTASPVPARPARAPAEEDGEDSPDEIPAPEPTVPPPTF